MKINGEKEFISPGSLHTFKYRWTTILFIEEDIAVLLQSPFDSLTTKGLILTIDKQPVETN